MSAADPAHDATSNLGSEGLGALVRRRGASVGVTAVVGLLVVALLVWALGSGSPPEMTPTAAEDAGDDEVTDPDPELDDVADEAEIEALPAVTYEVYLARDPFDPVVPEDDPDVTDPADPDDPNGDDPDPADPDDPDPSDPDPSDPDPSGPRPSDPDPADPDDPERCLGDEEVVCNGQVVSLMDLTEEDGEQIAVIQVDTTVYEVRSGETFAERFRLLSIGDGQVEALFGDTRFTLPLGETVMK